MWINYDDNDNACYYDNDEYFPTCSQYNPPSKHDTDPCNAIDEDKTPVIKIQGSQCRVCDDYNYYIPADNVTDDGKHTCYRCITSPYRWKKNVPQDKIDDLKLHYKDILKNYNF